MHPHLQRQLEQLGLASESPPSSPSQWQLFLKLVSDSYHFEDMPLNSGLVAQAKQDLTGEPDSPFYSPAEAQIDRLRASVCCLGAGLFILDVRGFVVAINPEAERLLGWPESEIVGANFLSCIARSEEP